MANPLQSNGMATTAPQSVGFMGGEQYNVGANGEATPANAQAKTGLGALGVNKYTGYVPPITASTTTISNANKINQVPGIINATNELSKTGISTDPQGNATYSNGTLVPQITEMTPATKAPVSDTSTGGYYGDSYFAPGTPIENLPKDAKGKPVALTESSPTDDRILSNIQSLKSQSDAITTSLIDGIGLQYEQLRQQQQEANAAANASTRNALLMGGVTGKGSSSQYAPISSSGIIQAQINYGLRKIADFNAKEQSAIIDAQAAGASRNYELMDKYNQEISKIRDTKVQAAQKLSDDIAEKNKKLAEKNLQSSRDSAIAGLYSQGITNPSQILDYLNFYDDGTSTGGGFTAEEVANTLKSLVNPDKDAMNNVLLEAAKYGATSDVLNRIQGADSIPEAILAAGDSLSIEYRQKLQQQEFDNNIKLKQLLIDQARLDLDQQKLTNSGMTEDDLLAYAQQYAATGQIPTGLPKGTFGAVSKLAGTLPKPDGTIIDVNTGTAPAKLSASQKDGISALYDLTKKVDEAGELFKTFRTGIFAGLWNKLSPTDQNTAYNVLRGEIVDLLSRARSGAALTESEIKEYEQKIPSRFVNAFETGPEGIDVLKGLSKSLSEKLNTTLKANGIEITGYGDAALKSPDMQKASEFDNQVKAYSTKAIPMDKVDFNSQKYTPLQQKNLSYGPSLPSNLKVSIGAGAAVKNNNPGNLRNIDGSWMKFNTPQEGFKALMGYLERAKSGDHTAYNSNQTLYQFFSKYAPAADSNNPKAYAENVAKKLGVSPGTKIGQLDTFAWAKEIARHESSTNIG